MEHHVHGGHARTEGRLHIKLGELLGTVDKVCAVFDLAKGERDARARHRRVRLRCFILYRASLGLCGSRRVIVECEHLGAIVGSAESR